MDGTPPLGVQQYFSEDGHLLWLWGSLLETYLLVNMSHIFQCLLLQERQEMQVQSPGGEDPLEKEMATHSSILAWRIPWTEEPGRLQSMGLQRVGHDWAAKTAIASTLISIILEQKNKDRCNLLYFSISQTLIMGFYALWLVFFCVINLVPRSLLF